MSTKEQKVKVDADYSLMPVPRHARRNIVTMFMIMLGFTFSQPVCGPDRSWESDLI